MLGLFLIETTINYADRKTGTVNLQSYWYYIKAGTPCLFLTVVLAMSFGKGVEVWSTFYLSNWSEEAKKAEMGGFNNYSEINLDYLSCPCLFDYF